MPLPPAVSSQDQKGVIDHRSGIPGAFGVGDVSDYLEEVSQDEEDPVTASQVADADQEVALAVADPVTDDVATHRLPLAVPEMNRKRSRTSFLLSPKFVVLVALVFLAAIAVLLGVSVTGVCVARQTKRHSLVLWPPRRSARLSRKNWKQNLRTYLDRAILGQA
jgi:hypothetical protein